MAKYGLWFWAFLYTELLLLCWSAIDQLAELVGVACWGTRAVLMEQLSIYDRCEEQQCLVKCSEQILVRRREMERQREVR
jgi:hypothetical protein